MRTHQGLLSGSRWLWVHLVWSGRRRTRPKGARSGGAGTTPSRRALQHMSSRAMQMRTLRALVAAVDGGKISQRSPDTVVGQPASDSFRWMWGQWRNIVVGLVRYLGIYNVDETLLRRQRTLDVDDMLVMCGSRAEAVEGRPSPADVCEPVFTVENAVGFRGGVIEVTAHPN